MGGFLLFIAVMWIGAVAMDCCKSYNYDCKITYEIKPQDFKMRLMSMKLFCRNILRTLNNHLQSEIPDDNKLVDLIPRIEYQIQECSYLLTNFGEIKENDR